MTRRAAGAPSDGSHLPQPAKRGVLLAAAVLLLASGLVVWLIVQQSAGARPGYDAAASIDDRALAIENELQCPICQNVTVAYSNSTLAGQMRQVVRQQLEEGQSHDQIIQYFVDRYGEAILTEPPKHGLNLLVWLLPLGGLLLGLGVIRSQLASAREPAAGPEARQPLTTEDELLLERALREGA